MKKIILLIVAIFFSYIATYAGNGNTIHNTITKQMKVPASLKKQKLDEKVNVEFKVENGKASVISVQTSNAELKRYIIEQFGAMSFSSTAEKQGTTYFVAINFKVL
ncbi:MAG: hypothetical protein JWO44_831 [Bacteroidetes bacterium]|jgi:hypothetical protein|nr:hypothetical protein [Bacteroidota bacterium]